jgi:hypothetical protein
MCAQIGKIIVTLCIGCLIIQGSIQPCTCLCCYSVEDKVAHSNLVFLGRVIATKLDESMATYVATFEVLQMWKGKQSSPIDIKTGIHNSMCGVIFNTGWMYLVFSDGAATDFCLGSYDANLASDDLKKLGKPIWINPKARPWSR